MENNQSNFLGEDSNTNDQKMLVLSWSLTVGVLTLIFIIVIFMMRKD